MDISGMKKNKKLINILRILAIILILFAILRGIFVLGVLILLSFSMSFIVNRFKLRNIGVELVTLVAVLTGMTFGPWIALIITFILISYHLMAGGFFGPYLFWVIPAYSLSGMIIGFLQPGDIVNVGVYTTILINVTNSFFTGITSPKFLPKYLIYATSNIIFNIILFNAFGNFLLKLIS